MPNLALLGVPIDLGAGRRGVDMGPSAVRYTGLQPRLAALGYHVADLGNLPVPLAETMPLPPEGEPLRYLEPIATLSATLADRVADCVAQGQLPLILGGDHSLAIGSVSGSARQRALGLLWIDAHADYNTAATTPSGNIHGMSLAALTGHGHPRLTNLAGRVPAVRPEHVAIVGLRDLDPPEREALRHSAITVFTMHDVDRQGMAAVVAAALRVVMQGHDGFHLSFDLDVLDPREAPGVGTPVTGGLSRREAHLAMELIAESCAMRSLDIVEVNPILDQRNATGQLAAELALSALGKRTL
ncbi:MAG: arginase [Candidatus Viridilinea halotolerans]|uniref:Arginase n=1 Tax=Candidatus Viridilinea halotolerans TaxID=2491704 RepID=A0A426TUW1_9CHLR|nr:MAG: arginase [Candidatus Viridilinea halotolerans]